MFSFCSVLVFLFSSNFDNILVFSKSFQLQGVTTEDNTWKCFGVNSTEVEVCSHHGVCISENKCECINRYFLPNCSLWKCFGINKTSQGVCNGHGSCPRYNYCICEDGYFGYSCENFTCFSVSSSNSSFVCSGHGKCVGMNKCECDGKGNCWKVKNGYEGKRCNEENNVRLPCAALYYFSALISIPFLIALIILFCISLCIFILLYCCFPCILCVIFECFYVTLRSMGLICGIRCPCVRCLFPNIYASNCEEYTELSHLYSVRSKWEDCRMHVSFLLVIFFFLVSEDISREFLDNEDPVTTDIETLASCWYFNHPFLKKKYPSQFIDRNRPNNIPTIVGDLERTTEVDFDINEETTILRPNNIPTIVDVDLERTTEVDIIDINEETNFAS